MTVKEETIENAVFAAELLRQGTRIYPDKIYIAGHSIGDCWLRELCRRRKLYGSHYFNRIFSETGRNH